MQALLTDEQDNFEHLRSSLDTVPTEALISIGDSFAEIMTTKDTFGWARQYEETHISHL